MALKKFPKMSTERIEFPAKVVFAPNSIEPPPPQPKPKAKKVKKQQKYLKQQYSCPPKVQEPQHRVWRKIYVRTTLKPKVRLPRLFRTDRRTGLPLDYESTVSKIMHYVNPQLSSSPQPHQIRKELLARKMTGIIKDMNQTDRCPHTISKHIRMIMKGHETRAKRTQNDENLSEFHSACKRGPVMPEPLAPTYKSRFNYNNLKIQSK